MLRRMRLLLISITVLAVVGVGAVGAESLLRVMFSWPTYIDPAVGFDYSSSTALVNLYDSLVYPEPDGSVAPHAAVRWETSEDGLTYTFYLRQGIQFHTGGEMTAEDVKFSMDRLQTIGEGYAYLFADVAETKVLDPYTVQFVLNKPFGPFVMALVRLYILDKDAVLAHLAEGPYGDYGDYGKEWLRTHDAGSGAYTVEEFPFEEYLLLKRFPGYWGETAERAPELVKMIRFTNAVTEKSMVSRHELEISDQWQTTEFYQSTAEMEGVDVASFPNGLVYFIMLNTAKPPTDDIHFRKALSYLFDYDQAVQYIFPGMLQAHGPVSSLTPGYKEGLFQYHYDLDKAREELEKSRYYDQLDDYPVVIGVNTDVPETEKVGLLLQAEAAKLGIDVVVQKLTWGKICELVATPETTPNGVTINVAPHYAEAGSMLQAKYHSSNTGTWEQAEWLLDPEIDALIDDALTTVDQEERFAKYGVIQEKIVDLAPDIFMVELLERHAYQSTYLDWPQLDAPNPVMGYNFDYRFYNLYSEKMP